MTVSNFEMNKKDIFFVNHTLVGLFVFSLCMKGAEYAEGRRLTIEDDVVVVPLKKESCSPLIFNTLQNSLRKNPLKKM